jgi:hypothetical protein
MWMGKQHLTSLQTGLVFLGLLAWAIAIVFGCMSTVEVRRDHPWQGVATSSQAGAACGFAVAGGLCFLGVALAALKSEDHAEPVAPAARPRD